MNGLTRMYFPTKDIKISVVMKREDILQEIEQESRDIVPKKVLEVWVKLRNLLSVRWALILYSKSRIIVGEC
jgi:hypothetical protein